MPSSVEIIAPNLYLLLELNVIICTEEWEEAWPPYHHLGFSPVSSSYIILLEEAKVDLFSTCLMTTKNEDLLPTAQSSRKTDFKICSYL